MSMFAFGIDTIQRKIQKSNIEGIMYKKDIIWIATANLLYPNNSTKELVSEIQIKSEIMKMFRIKITPVMLRKHLVSWENRQANPKESSMGGGRYRYLFHTKDGITPSTDGKYRLYKKIDKQFDGNDKDGEIHPNPYEIPDNYMFLIDWYEKNYFEE
jgi:hypothetical protein